MREFGAFEAKTHLSELLAAAAGKSVTIMRRGQPVARLVPVSNVNRDRSDTARRIAKLRKHLARQGVSLSQRDILSVREEGRR